MNVVVKLIFEVILLKKVRGVIKDNYLYCGHCGACSIKKDEKGKIVLSGNFQEVKDGYGMLYYDTKQVYSQELNKSLIELSCTCKLCGSSNSYLLDLEEGVRYEEIGQIDIIKDENLDITDS